MDNDRSGFISRVELEALNNMYRLNLSEEDMRLMIDCVSRDKQKVKKEDLYEFLTKSHK